MSRSEPKFYMRIATAPSPPTQAGLSRARVAFFDQKLRDFDRRLAEIALATKTDASAELAAARAGVEARRAAVQAQRDAAAAELALAPGDGAQAPDAIADIAHRVLSVEYADDEKKTDLLKLSLDNKDLALFDHEIFDKDTLLEVAWGYVGNMCPVRKVIVQKVTGNTTLTVEAQDMGCLLNKVAYTRVYNDASRSDVARLIALAYGFSEDGLHVEDTEVVYTAISQAGITDAQFLKKLADLEGFEFYLDHDGFHFHPRRLDQKPVRAVTYYLPPDVGDVLSFGVESDVSNKKGAVTAAGRDPKNKTDVRATADTTNTPRTTLAAASEVTSPQASQVPEKVVDLTTGETKTVYRPAAAPAPTAASATMPTTATSNAQAQRQAQGALKRAQQAQLTLTLNLVGDPHMAAKSVLEVRGLGKRLSGLYYITEAKHTLGSSGYTTSVKCKRDGKNGEATTDKTAAVQNKKQADEEAKNAGAKPPPALVPEKVVDLTTGETKTVYKDTSGRQNGGAQ